MEAWWVRTSVSSYHKDVGPWFDLELFRLW